VCWTKTFTDARAPRLPLDRLTDGGTLIEIGTRSNLLARARQDKDTGHPGPMDTC
jgi:hypothetical protein